MSEKHPNPIGDVVRAFAASDLHAGLAFGLVHAAEYVDRPFTKVAMKRDALKHQTISMIQFDRSITGDPRGVQRTLPEIEQ